MIRSPPGRKAIKYDPTRGAILPRQLAFYEADQPRNGASRESRPLRRHDAMDAGSCGWSAQVLGPKSIQRDYDGTPMVTYMLSEHEILTFAKIPADRDEGFIELGYQETGEEGCPPAEATKRFFEKVAAVAERPIRYQGVAPNSVHPEQHLERIRWQESCAERALRVYGQRAHPPRRVRDDLCRLEPVRRHRGLAGTDPGYERRTQGQMQDPQMRHRRKEQWDSGTRPTTVVPRSVSIRSPRILDASMPMQYRGDRAGARHRLVLQILQPATTLAPAPDGMPALPSAQWRAHSR
jgi:hypothetical protein